uniref:Uncharacterized protein n=1 Tax=Physcomitrium patens TaxID=3218 RepID=A0A2K1K9W9_PHYPA|nr:hypothetical protein PHYPA_009754 [Physcomitrium patens]
MRSLIAVQVLLIDCNWLPGSGASRGQPTLRLRSTRHRSSSPKFGPLCSVPQMQLILVQTLCLLTGCMISHVNHLVPDTLPRPTPPPPFPWCK